MMNKKVRVAAIGISALVVGLIVMAGFGQAVHYLWNWLMPEIFGLRAISYWQALGLLGLCWILFGGARFFSGGTHRHRHSGGRFFETWAKMTPEEREQFRAGFRGRCGQESGAGEARL